MKKLLFCATALSTLFACTNPTAKENTPTEAKAPAIEHIFKPTYTDNFKIGDSKNVLLAEQVHQAMFDKDFKKVADFIVDTVVFHMEDGSTIKGKADALAYMEKSFSQINIKNYKIAAIIPVVGENGDQWVLIFDEADIETPDGKSQKVQWMDSFQYKDGKIVRVNGYAKSPKA